MMKILLVICVCKNIIVHDFWDLPRMRMPLKISSLIVQFATLNSNKDA